MEVFPLLLDDFGFTCGTPLEVYGDVLVRVSCSWIRCRPGQRILRTVLVLTVDGDNQMIAAISWWALINSTEICGHIVVRPYKFHRLGLFTLDFWSRHLHPWNSWTPLEVITICIVDEPLLKETWRRFWIALSDVYSELLMTNASFYRTKILIIALSWVAYIPGYGPDKHQRLSLASIQVGLKNTWIVFIRVGLKNTRLSRLCREELVHETCCQGP